MPEPLHTQACLEYAAKTKKAYCIAECSDERIERLKCNHTSGFRTTGDGTTYDCMKCNGRFTLVQNTLEEGT